MDKKLLSIAVGATLAAAGGLARANHDLLIPYVVKDANRTTVVTLIGSGAPVNTGANMHLQYYSKSTTDANTAACAPSSVYVPFTDNDIMTFDTAGLLGYPLFGDSTNPAPLGTAMGLAAPRHGYLTVVNDNGHGGMYRSYWLELDLTNGGAHGDVGMLNRTGETGSFNFNNNPWTALFPGRPFDWEGDGSPSAAVSFWPSAIAATAFTVTPLGSDMPNKENNTVVLQILNSNGVQGAYDRNENGVDGTTPVTVRCVGRVSPNQLMPGVVTNAAWAAQGGWGFLANLGDANGNTQYVLETGFQTMVAYIQSGSASAGNQLYYTTVEPVSYAIRAYPLAAVYQVDSSTAAGGKFMSNATRITSHAGLNTFRFEESQNMEF